MTLKNAVTKGVKAWRDRRVGYWLCIDPKTGEYYLLTSESMNIGGRATRRLRGRNLRSTSATAFPSSSRPGFIWTT